MIGGPILADMRPPPSMVELSSNRKNRVGAVGHNAIGAAGPVGLSLRLEPASHDPTTNW